MCWKTEPESVRERDLFQKRYGWAWRPPRGREGVSNSSPGERTMKHW